MKTILLLLALSFSSIYNFTDMSIYDFRVSSLDGGTIDFADFRGKKILVVNTASECGFTPQYELLQNLQDEYPEKLVIVGFPANNFGGQEPGTNDEIAVFCQKNYGVTFPMAAKVSVKGEDQHELFKWLTQQKNPDGTGDIKWNFEKFLLDENGKLIRRYGSAVLPTDLEIIEAIEE